MIVPGQFNVNATGAATYTMPIAVPPGSAGMVPALSLDYSSQSGDGIEGIGWTLSGLPSISRCPRTLAQDSIHGSVNYDSNDRFCMEGQRLILISGTYGADGSEYRTEIESFSKIIAHGSAGSGPAWFEVHTKSGQIMQFGNTTDSRVLVVNVSSGVTSTARSWTVNKISDTAGNYLTVTYNCTAVSGACTDTSRTTYGQAYPLQIDYTGNALAGVNPYNSVEFSYTSRVDGEPSYQAGGIAQTKVLLTDVKTYQGSTLVHDYQLGYRSGTTTTHSRLTSVTLCDGASHCLNPTTFGWQGGAGYLSMSGGTSESVATGKVLVPGDYNNDGLTDVLPLPLYYSAPPCQATYSAYSPPGYTTVVGSITNPISSGLCGFTQASQTILAPNGTSNILTIETSNTGAAYAVVQSPRPGSVQGIFPIPSSYYLTFPPQVFAGDINGDGIVDLLFQVPALPSGSALDYYYGLPSGGFGSIVAGPSYSSYPAFVPADFDGDGCVDLYVLNGSATINYNCNPATPSASAPSVSGYSPVFGDFNGDGKTDIMLVSKTGAATLWLSTGSGFTEVNSSVASGSTGSSDWGKYIVYTGDWNGDGKADILLVAPGTTGNYGAGTTHKLYLSTGTDFTPAVDSSSNPITISNPTNGATALPADWNSDGATDIWIQGTSPNDLLYTFSYIPELMTSVSNGIGSTTNIAYAPLNTNGSLYTRGTSATFPYQDMNGPIYVVSRVDASNGLGTCNPSSSYTYCYSSAYAYAGAQTNVQGRGFVGFASVIVTDLQTNIVQTTNYGTAFPYMGLVTAQTKTHSGTTLSSTTNTYSTGTGCGSTVSPISGVDFVCLTQMVAASNDLNGTAYPGTTTTNTYDNYGNALIVNVSVTDGSSKDTTNTYSNDTTNWFLGRLLTTSVNSIVGSSNLTRQSSFSYDSGTGLLSQEAVESGVSTCNSGLSSCTLTTSYTYDAFGHRITTTVSGSGIATRTSYAFFDSLGEFQTSAANALGQYEFWAYDARFGRPTSHTGPNFLTTTWSYDGFGRMTQEVRPDGTQTNQSYAYCSGGCPTHGQFYSASVMDAPGGAPQIGPSSYAFYDMLSRAVANDAQGFDSSYIRVATVYDANGRIQETSRPYFANTGVPAWTNFAYDNLGRIIQATFPDTSVATYTFSGLTTTATNSLGQTTTTVRNAQGLIDQVTDTSSHTTTYSYDAFGDVLTVIDPAGNVVSNTFDVRGNKVSSQDPDMGNWTYTYDVLSELTSQTDAKRQTRSLSYDVLGRPLTRLELDLYSTWIYGNSASAHNVGKLIEAKACPTSACASLISDKAYLFDGVGRENQFTLQTATDYFGYATTYNTTNGQIASVRYPSGYLVSRTYNSTGFIKQLSDATAAVWTINARDAELHITSQTAGNNVTTIQTFDPNTGLIQHQRARNGSVASFDYSFDTIGNLTTRTDNSQPYTEWFCYDSLNRLTGYNIGAACTGGNTASYDSIGNITAKSGTGSYSYGGASPHAVSSITGTVDGLTNPNYAYDRNGNLTCISSGSGCSGTIGRTVNLTSFNRASSIGQGSNSLSLTYDDQHQRLTQVNTVSGTATTSTVYLNDTASGAMSERVASGGATPTVWNSFNWNGAPWGGTAANVLPSWTDYITLDGQIVAQRKVSYPLASAWGSQAWNGFIWGTPAGSQWGSTAGTNPPRFTWGTDPWSGNAVTWAYFNLDHLGSVAVITDQGGNVVQRLSFDPWGKQRNPNGTDAACGAIAVGATTRGFTNEEQMPTPCLVNLNARLYDASIGKFLAADPVVGDPFLPNAFNRYSYVSNNPLSFTDRSGLCFLGCLLKSPIVGGLLEVGLFAVGLPELEGLNVLSAGSAGLASLGVPTLAANGALAGAVSAGVSGGNVARGALFGGLSAGLSAGPGAALGNSFSGALTSAGVGSAASSVIGNAVAQGVIGGIVSIAQGGNGGAGFLAAGVGSLAGGFSGGHFSIGNLVASTALGGAVSVLGGGKFANGAVTGAFSYAAGASYANDNNPSDDNAPPAPPASVSGCLEYCGGVGPTNIANSSGGADITWTGLSQDVANYILGNHGFPGGAGKSSFFQQFSTPDSLADLATYATSYGQETARGVPAGSNGYAVVATYPTTVGIDAYTGLPTNRYVVYTTPTTTVNLGVVSVGVRQVTNIFPRASGQ